MIQKNTISSLNGIDILISFDTTGSMYPCLSQVIRNISELSVKLFNEIDDLRIGLIAHGDYCDGNNMINKWRENSRLKTILLIGDAPPHMKNENPYNIDWIEET